MRVLQIGSDRSKRGILYPESPAALRQRAYGEYFDALDIIGFSLRSDGRSRFQISPTVSVCPTNSLTKLLYGLDTLRIMHTLPYPDVISVQDPFESGLLGVLISKLYKVPLHVQVHTDFTAPEYRAHSILNRVRVILARYVVRRAARIRVISERIKKGREEPCTTAAPISILPIYVDVETFKNAAPDTTLLERFSAFATKTLVVSRLEPEKNVALAIKAIAESAPGDACLIIVGEGSERKNLENLVQELHVSDRVFFEGEHPAIEYYPLADLVLVTSYYEGYGLVIIEALASSKPVISTDVGSAREMGVTVTSVEDFPVALKEWFENGPYEMHLKNYPYKDLAEYARMYTDDIAKSIKK